MQVKLIGKLRKNLSLILLFSIVLIPVLAMSYFLVSDYSYRKEEEIRKNQQMAIVLAENLDSYLENVKATLAGVSTLPPVQNHDRLEIEQVFQGLMLADNQVSLYWAADSNGQFIAKYPNYWPDKTDDNFMKTVLSAPNVIIGPRKGRTTGIEIITLSTLIRNESGEKIGVIGASIPLEKLRKKLSLKVGIKGYPILVTKSGKFLVHPQREEINKTINLDDPIFRTILKGGSGTVDTVAPFDNQRKFFSYVPLQQAEWILVVIQPQSEFQAHAMKFVTRNGLLIVLVALVVILAAHYLMLFRRRDEEARLQQAEKLSIVGQLAAGMAHEIRNPLTAIKGFAQLAATRDLKLTSEYLEIIMNEVDRIESIVKETLLLAKPAPVQFRPVVIQQILKDVHALMQPQTNLKGVTLLMEIEKDLPVIIGEANHLKQVFINILRNSIDAAPNYGGRILIYAKASKGNISITIHDNGLGIPAEIIDKLGNPFVSTKDNGTGLGLMVSYRIIQNHGGKISVESIEGQGTKFILVLPIAQKIKLP